MEEQARVGIQAVPGLRVLEVGRRLGVASAGLSLAALGADVAQVRLAVRSVPRAEAVYYDRGRTSLETDYEGDLSVLAALADVVLTDLADDEMEARGLPVHTEALRSGPDPQVLVAVRSLGRTGPNSSLRMTDLTEWASSGLAQITRRPHDALARYVPVLPPGSQPQALAGLAAATAALAGLRLARRSSAAVVAEISVQEAVAAMLHGVFPNFVWNGIVTGHPSTPATSLGLMVPASDGDVYIRTLDPRQWDALMDWVDSDTIRALGPDPDSRLANNDAIRLLLAEWSAPQRRAALLAEGQRRRVPTALPRSLDDVLAWQHLRARGVWRPVELDGAEAVAPRIPLVEPPAWTVTRWASPAELAQRWAQTPARRAGGGGARPVEGARPTSGSPLDGVRVLDFGWTWAGPYCGMILADLGADVIKIETGHRIDMLRLSGAFADGVRDLERCGWYGATNRGKRSVTVNLKHPDGRALVADLVRRSDVAIENFAPRVLPGLGLGWEDMQSLNPGMVLLSLSAYGATGPEHEYVAYGDHLSYASGLASVIGHPDDGPTPINTFYGDPVAGMYGALAIVAALEERERTGQGRHLEYSQVEGLLTMMAGPLIRRSSGQQVERLVDKSPDMAPHGFYRCAGDDAWVSIAVETDQAWVALREALVASGVELGGLPRLADRKSAEATLDQAIAAWTATLSPWQVTSVCQGLGVAAYPMMNSARLARDVHLHEREFFQWVTHPVVGPGPVPGVIFRIGEQGARVRGPAPTLGQHNEEVLMGLLGITRDRFERLVAGGAVS